MRNLVILAILLLAAFLAGWFTIHGNEDRTTIEINRDEIRQDTQQMLDRGREFLQQVEPETNAINALQAPSFRVWNQQTQLRPAG